MVSITSPADLPMAASPALAPKSSLRQAPVARKVRSRQEAGMDEDPADSHKDVGNGKRVKIAHDADVSKVVLGVGDKSLELIRHEVRLGLEKYRRGDQSGYDRIKELFGASAEEEEEDAPSAATVSNYVVALMGNVSLLDKSCGGLVYSMLDGDWLGRDEAFVALFIRFLGNLASAQGCHVRTILSVLVGRFVGAPYNMGHLPHYPVVRRSQHFDRIHMALKYMLRLIPAASSAVSSILAIKFPNKSESKRSHTNYIRNLLRLVSYAPELKAEVLALTMERLVKIDVQIQVDMEDLEDDVGEDLAQELPKPPNDHLSESDESDSESVSSDESLDEEAIRLKEVKADVEKMDAILDILFTVYAPCFSVEGSLESQRMFEMLLTNFANVILPTYRSRHTQFLLFHFAQTSPLLIDTFAGTCIHLAFDPGRSSIIKQSAAAYLASFVARGAHVPTQVVRDVFDLIGVQLNAIWTEQERNCRGPDLRRYGSFYSMVQALLYIFCFRWRDLLASPEDYLEDDDPALFDSNDLIWAPGIKDILTRTIYSKFNPLKVCSPSIVTEFARIANHLHFLYVFPLLESNKRLRLSQLSATSAGRQGHVQAGRDSALTARRDEAHQQLDAYFPFDPYNLPMSKRWVEGDYVEWRGVPGLDDPRTRHESETEAEVDVSEGDGDHRTETESDAE